jgi:hypothetical protein
LAGCYDGRKKKVVRRGTSLFCADIDLLLSTGHVLHVIAVEKEGRCLLQQPYLSVVVCWLHEIVEWCPSEMIVKMNAIKILDYEKGALSLKSYKGVIFFSPIQACRAFFIKKLFVLSRLKQFLFLIRFVFWRFSE